ncbi:MAG: tetratricopeptide repeat protein, partial [Kiritimatiellae bacterium]|nr:tetratricopeptide repeat protein [Kiritimatiellia bacterium]
DVYKRQLEEASLGQRNAVARLHTWIGVLQEARARGDLRDRMLYEAAWCHRLLAEAEQELATQRWRDEAIGRARKRIAQQALPGDSPFAFRVSEPQQQGVVPSADELAARRCYEQLARAATDSQLAIRARIELADLLIRRGELQTAKTWLSEAITRGPDRNIVDALRVRLAMVALAEDDPATALAHAETVMAGSPGPLAPEAAYLAGEALFRQRNWSKAIERFAPFRDKPPWQNLPELTERALLRLGQAYLEKGDGGSCRQTLQTLIQRFPQSQWLDEALCVIGISLQKEKQYDQAVETFQQIVRRSVSEWAARAQYQIGICRVEQKKYEEAVQAFLAVPLTYDYMHWHPPALYEAARAYEAMKQREQAAELWRRIVENYPMTPWARSAGEELKKIDKENL